jgi:hypothetical protein
MALRDAWSVCNPELDARFAGATATFLARGKPSNVKRFFHGTSRDSASAIIGGGFRLPPHAGMYGKGLSLPLVVVLFIGICSCSRLSSRPR